MKITYDEFKKIDEYEKSLARKANAGIVFRKATAEDRKAYPTTSTMYRLEFPHQSIKQATDTLNRCDMFFRRNVKTSDTFVILALSTHKHWTPYADISGKRGGAPKKVFNEMPYYKTEPHIHIDILGKHARSLAERIYRNQSRKMKLKPFKDVCRSQHSICPLYIKWQSDLYREFGGRMEDFIITSDELDFDG